MATYNPPTEILSIFNPNDFTTDEGGALTEAVADLRYLKFPFAQGLENLQSTIINGDLTLNNTEIHLGTGSGVTQGANAVAIGSLAGASGQSAQGVALGYLTGQTNQGLNATALGHNAGNSGQGNQAVAIGHNAGQTTQGLGAIAIGLNSGLTSQGDRSISIGSNSATASQSANSIQINATNTTITQTTASSCIIAPIRGTTPETANISAPLLYDTTTKEVFTNSRPIINLLSLSNTPDNSYYNSFIIVSTSITTSGIVNIPTAVVTFPATLDIYNNSSNSASQTLTTAGGLIVPGLTGYTATTTFVIPAQCFIRLQSTGTNWLMLTSSGGNQITNTLGFGYVTAPTLTSTQLGYTYNTTGITNNFALTSTDILTLSSIPVGTYIMSYQVGLNAGQTAGGSVQTQLSVSGVLTGGVIYLPYSTAQLNTITNTFTIKVTTGGIVKVVGLAVTNTYTIQNASLQLTRIA